MTDADFDFDLFVVGGGSGGARAARIAAGYGARVALAEEHRYGGTCVIRGCVPKKLMVYASSYAEMFEDARGYGWAAPEPGSIAFDWDKFRAAKDAEIARLEGIYRSGLEKAGVANHACRATVTGPHTVRLADHGQEISAKHILIATGGRPFVPEFPGSHHVITSNEVFDLAELPKRILIAGGGYIACEFACILNGLGVETTLIYRGPEILNGFDQDVRPFVRAEMEKKGVRVILSQVIDRIEKTDAGLSAALTNGETVVADTVLFATGRRPYTEGLGLETADITLAPNGAVPVDRYSQTSTPSIFAVGDVTDRLNLTPIAIREGHAFADTIFGAKPTAPDHDLAPTAVFTQPEIGTVGLTEEQARADYDVEIYRAAFRPMMHSFSGRDERMLMKLVVDKGSRRVLGVHIVGHGAGEMIQCVGVAVKMGATKEQFDQTVAVHPTAAEELVTMRTPVGAA
ncbi:MAG: glutathione-disulfide reductase [Neomegalonema sp.]|nr:glutathione-disulfide reductase [Neomegalonema sp.]